jgi:cellulose synthase/poly-beta-1,6-N-acetylglucosamine synthase-like glycosyltransferase
LESEPSERPFLSVVVTVRNEERHLGPLLDSLLAQEPPFEIVLVDALSRDATYPIAEQYARAHPTVLRVFRRYGSRAIGRNHGVRMARGDFVVFTDGDCVAHPDWLRTLRHALASRDVVAGKTVPIGDPKYAALQRVELYQQGSDVTYPSCNLAYRRAFFDRLGGFDPRFITAEDIDLNLRAVRAGARLGFVRDAVVYHRARETVVGFLFQAFWNGYGRKQLTEKHGVLWGHYRIRRLVRAQRSVLALGRMFAALAGYGVRLMTAGSRRLAPAPTPPPRPTASASGAETRGADRRGA